MGCFPSKDQTENSHLVAGLSDRDAYASLSAILQRSENKSVVSVARSEASARWHSFPASHFSLRYGAVSQRGHYPEAPNKDNQDRWCVHVPYGGSAEQALFGVFDGHGDFGSQCAAFAAHAVRVPLRVWKEVAVLCARCDRRRDVYIGPYQGQTVHSCHCTCRSAGIWCLIQPSRPILK